MSEVWSEFAKAEFPTVTLQAAQQDALERALPAEYNPAALGFKEEARHNSLDKVVNRINRRVVTGGGSDASDVRQTQKTVAADREAMKQAGIFDPAVESDITERLRRATIRRRLEGTSKEALTPLGVQLLERIESEGPLSIAAFMQLCLLDPADGFYSTKQAIGPAGSFTTAPEASPLFTHAVARWVLVTWLSLGSPAAFDLVELGPGSGAMMFELIRQLRALPGGRACLDAATVTMVEAAPGMQQRQMEKLKGVTDVNIAWHLAVDAVTMSPRSRPLIVLGNEFLDALPVRHFVHTGSTWNDVRVAVNDDPTRPLHFGLTWHDQPTALGRLFEAIFTAPTTERAAAYRKLRAGSVVEWSPKSMIAFHELAIALARRRGAALIIDYGCFKFPRPAHKDVGYSCSDPDRGAPTLTTLRGIRDHAVVPWLSKPGATDITADVNFDHLAMILEDTDGLEGAVSVHPAISQSDFLSRMGIETELLCILRQMTDRTLADELMASYRSVVGSGVDDRGWWFKAMGVASADLGGACGFAAV